MKFYSNKFCILYLFIGRFLFRIPVFSYKSRENESLPPLPRIPSKIPYARKLMFIFPVRADIPITPPSDLIRNYIIIFTIFNNFFFLNLYIEIFRRV